MSHQFLLSNPHNSTNLSRGCMEAIKCALGHRNWSRWTQVMERCGVDSLDTFVTWLLDLAERELVLSSDPTLPMSAVSSNDAVENVGGDGDGVDISFLIPSRTFFCSQCQVSLSDTEIVKEHMKLRHDGLRAQISCFCCQQQFGSISSYIEYHKAARLSESSSQPRSHRHVCSHCAKSFSAKRDLEDHVANKHLKLGPRHQCPTCEKRFSHSNNLRIHRKKCGVVMLELAATATAQQEQFQFGVRTPVAAAENQQALKNYVQQPELPLHEQQELPLHEQQELPLHEQPDIRLHEQPEIPLQLADMQQQTQQQ